MFIKRNVIIKIFSTVYKMQNITRQNQTINLKELFLANLLTTSFGGGTLSTYLIVPISVFGTIFNTISLIIFLKRSFRKIAYFKYITVYTATSLIITSTLICGFYFNVAQLFDLAISFSARIFRCYIIPSYLVSFFFFYSNVIDIIINIERAINFGNKYQKLKKISSYIVCIVSLIVCLIVNLPLYFLYDAVQDKDLYTRFRLCIPSQFTQSSLGKVLQIVSYIIQGPVVLLLEVLSNAIALVSFRNFLKRKSQATNLQTTNVNSNQQRRQIKKEKMDKKLMWMTCYITGYSFIMHLIQFASQIIIFYIGTNAVLISIFTFLFSLIILIKHSTNIFFYYFFNKNFRKAINLCSKLSHNSDKSIRTASNSNENSTKTNKLETERSYK